MNPMLLAILSSAVANKMNPEKPGATEEEKRRNVLSRLATQQMIGGGVRGIGDLFTGAFGGAGQRMYPTIGQSPLMQSYMRTL